MKIKAKVKNDIVKVKMLIKHAMETGRRKDQDGNLIPGLYITEVSASHNGLRDSIDKDYVPIGSSSATKEVEFESEVLLTFEGDFEGDVESVDLTKLELLSYPKEIDFGEIEPDWWHEEQ